MPLNSQIVLKLLLPCPAKCQVRNKAQLSSRLQYRAGWSGLLHTSGVVIWVLNTGGMMVIRRKQKYLSAISPMDCPGSEARPLQWEAGILTV